MYIATYTIDIAALIFLFWSLYSGPAVNIYRKRPFLIGIILTLVVILSEAGTVFAGNGNFNLRTIHILCNVLGFALAPIIPLVIALIFDGRLIRNRKLLLFPSLINMIATLLSPLFGFVFYVDAYNRYFRGDYFSIFVAACLINFMLLVIATFKVSEKYNYPIMRKLVPLSLFTITGTSIQLANPSAYSSWHCITLSLILYFLLISEFDSSFDPLTGLYNRAALEKATRYLKKAKAFSVVALDINDFKRVNDTYGHDYGDTVIKAVAAVTSRNF